MDNSEDYNIYSSLDLLMSKESSAQQVPLPLQTLQIQQLSQIQSVQHQEEPLLVNARQFHRILKRRVARQKYEQAQKKQFVHLSRHLHAKKRPRGPGGRFLSAQELEQLQEGSERQEPEEQLNE